MKINLHQLNPFLFFTLVLSLFNVGYAQEINREFYQIKIYSFETDDQIKNPENYLKEAYLPALKRLNINNVGVFKPRVDSIKKIYVLIPFSSLGQFEGLDNKIESDKKYLKYGAGYITGSHEKPNYQRIESIILKAFIDMPKIGTEGDSSFTRFKLKVRRFLYFILEARLDFLICFRFFDIALRLAL